MDRPFRELVLKAAEAAQRMIQEKGELTDGTFRKRKQLGDKIVEKGSGLNIGRSYPLC